MVNDSKLAFELLALLLSISIAIIFLFLLAYILSDINMSIGDYQSNIYIRSNKVDTWENYTFSCSNFDSSLIHWSTSTDLNVNGNIIKVKEGYNYKFNDNTYFIFLDIDTTFKRCSFIIIKSKSLIVNIISKINNFIVDYYSIFLFIIFIILYILFKLGLLEKLLQYVRSQQ